MRQRFGEFFPGENSMFHPGCTAQPTPWVEAQGAGEPSNELRIVEIEFKENLLQ